MDNFLFYSICRLWRRPVFIGWFLLCITSLYAQDNLLAEVHLDELVVREKIPTKLFADSKYSTGTHLWEVDSALLSQLQNNTLADYISRNTSIFIKESGNGMMSSISLRGTSSSHTAVSWNGLNINPLTMGQVDFSLLPLFFFEKIAVHPGGESALYGNGSIGGSIVLGSEAQYEKRWKGLVQQSFGSYGYSFSGLKIQGGTEKWQSHTALLYNRSDNDFDIHYSTFSGEKIEKQQNAAYYNYGFTQDFYYKISSRDELSLNSWYTYNYREIQPSVQNNKHEETFDDILNRSVKAIVNYKHSGGLKWLTSAGYFNDYQLNQDDVIETHNIVASASAEKSWRKLSFKAGGSYQYIIPDVYSYASGVTEWRAGIYLLSKYKLSNALSFDVNLQQNLVEDIAVPFTPSAGVSWRLLQNPVYELTLRGNCSKSFKVPTLNDRYWGGLDNRYLDPEDGLNTEAGFEFSITKKKYNSSINFSAYHNRVDNWIMWMPRGDIWKPQNIDCVLARGLEIYWKQSLLLNPFQIELTVNYTYAKTTVEEAPLNLRSFEGRQMPLLPEHTANVLLQVNYRRLFANVGLNYVGERATSNIFNVMEAYTLVNASMGYAFDIKTQKLVLQLQANNIFDEQYETVPFKAMPWRNYCVSLKYIF
jgi:iron complex outermembrane receptor protein